MFVERREGFSRRAVVIRTRLNVDWDSMETTDKQLQVDFVIGRLNECCLRYTAGGVCVIGIPFACQTRGLFEFVNYIKRSGPCGNITSRTSY